MPGLFVYTLLCPRVLVMSASECVQCGSAESVNLPENACHIGVSHKLVTSLAHVMEQPSTRLHGCTLAARQLLRERPAAARGLAHMCLQRACDHRKRCRGDDLRQSRLSQSAPSLASAMWVPVNLGSNNEQLHICCQSTQRL